MQIVCICVARDLVRGYGSCNGRSGDRWLVMTASSDPLRSNYTMASIYTEKGDKKPHDQMIEFLLDYCYNEENWSNFPGRPSLSLLHCFLFHLVCIISRGDDEYVMRGDGTCWQQHMQALPTCYIDSKLYLIVWLCYNGIQEIGFHDY